MLYAHRKKTPKQRQIAVSVCLHKLQRVACPPLTSTSEASLRTHRTVWSTKRFKTHHTRISFVYVYSIFHSCGYLFNEFLFRFFWETAPRFLCNLAPIFIIKNSHHHAYTHRPTKTKTTSLHWNYKHKLWINMAFDVSIDSGTWFYSKMYAQFCKTQMRYVITCHIEAFSQVGYLCF